MPSSARATRISPPNERGEIAIRSAANIKGYWRNPEATAAAFTADGYLRTGDIGYLDEDGYLFIVDRKKDIIIRGGENISAAEVEAALYACDGDRRGGGVRRRPTSGWARCRSRSSIGAKAAASTRTSLRAFLDGRLAAFKIPARMIFSDEPLPRLGTGKIDRVALKQQYAALTMARPERRPPHPADRRRRRRRADRRLPRLAAREGSPLRAGPGEARVRPFPADRHRRRVTVAVPQVETGQGIWTGLAQIAADELGAAWENMAVEPAPHGSAYANRLIAHDYRVTTRITAGSTSIRAFEQPLREAAAAARAMLCAAAAERWGVTRRRMRYRRRLRRP